MIRRVVTAHDASGRSTIAADGPVHPLAIPGVGDLFRLWSTDEPMAYPDRGDDPQASAIFPPVGGFRAFIFTLQPSKVAVLEADDALRRAAPDLEAVMADASGLHETDTTDFEIIIAGEATLEMSDGSRTTLTRGDTVIHNGAAHKWINEGSEPAILAGCMVGASRSASGGT